MIRNSKSGFTLIELLVVIAIIGILSSVVLASLNTARNKGNDAKTEAQLAALRASAEVYYSTNGNYGSSVTSCASGMFADGTSGMSSYFVAGAFPTGVTPACGSTGTAYIVSANLIGNSGKYWCVDSNGNSKIEASNPGTTPPCA